MKKKNLKLKVIVCMLILAIVLSVVNIDVVKAQISSNLPVSYIDENFPSSYMSYINSLKAEHPNWRFKAVHTGLDWNTVLSHETYDVNDSISLVEDIYGPEWKRDGVNYYKDGNYVTASKAGVAYVLDPRNFLNNQGIFMFETLSFLDGAQSVDTVQGVLASTPMGSAQYRNKYKLNGEWKDLGKTYAEIIYSVSKEVGINPVHIASRIRQENSGNILNNQLINGDYGVYNFFNVGAFDDANGNATQNGVKYAKEHGWTSVEAGLKGGAEYIYSKYIVYGQNTIYFERFDVNNPGTAKYLLGTGYMTNIFACKSEALITYNTYANCGVLGNTFEFHIPVYDNMPESAVPSPESSGLNFVPDNTTVYLDDPSDTGVTDTFNVRAEPNEGSAILTQIVENKEGGENRQKLTRTGIGENTLFDRIRLPDGREGYVKHQYVYVYDYVKVESVKLDTTYKEANVGDTFKLNATVMPENAKNKTVTWSTNNPDVADVSPTGDVTAKKPGVATITVRTEDMGLSDICSVNVTGVKVSGVTFKTDNFSINVGDKITLEPKIAPDNATNKGYRYTMSNESLAKIEGDTLTAISSGTLYVSVITDDGGHQARAKIDIIDSSNENNKNNEGNITFDTSVKEKANVVTGIEFETKCSDFVKKISTEGAVEIKDINGKVLGDNDLIGTGTSIKLKGKEKEYHVVIYGDIDGTGTINSRDLLLLQRYLLEKADINEYQLKASIIDKVSSTPRAIDLLKMQRHIFGLYKIEQ